jgi:hypothetical protein
VRYLLASGFLIVTNDDSFPFDDDHRESGQPAQVAPGLQRDRQRDDPVRRTNKTDDVQGNQQDHDAQTHRRQPALVFVTTFAIALLAGVIGAMGYLHFFGPKPVERSSSSQSEAKSGKDSSLKGGSDGGTKIASGSESSTQGSTSSSIPGVSGSPEADELKQQIKTLKLKLDGLGERVDRLQHLLSLAVPLLQRISPKD